MEGEGVGGGGLRTRVAPAEWAGRGGGRGKGGGGKGGGGWEGGAFFFCWAVKRSDWQNPPGAHEQHQVDFAVCARSTAPGNQKKKQAGRRLPRKGEREKKNE